MFSVEIPGVVSELDLDWYIGARDTTPYTTEIAPDLMDFTMFEWDMVDCKSEFLTATSGDQIWMHSWTSFWNPSAHIQLSHIDYCGEGHFLPRFSFFCLITHGLPADQNWRQYPQVSTSQIKNRANTPCFPKNSQKIQSALSYSALLLPFQVKGLLRQCPTERNGLVWHLFLSRCPGRVWAQVFCFFPNVPSLCTIPQHCHIVSRSSLHGYTVT